MFLVNSSLSNLSYISIKLLVTFLYKYLCVPVLLQYTFLQCDGFSPLFVSFHISPHCVITTAIFGLLFGPVGTFSIFLKTKSPSITLPENKMEKQLEINRTSIRGAIIKQLFHIKIITTAMFTGRYSLLIQCF